MHSPEPLPPLPPLQPLPDAVSPGRYRHYKGGLYEVVATARHSETLEPLVVYRALAGSGWWVRPAAMFCDSVGGQPRFTPV